MSDFNGPARGGIIARHFRLPGFQSITTSSLKAGSLAVTRLTSETGDVEITNRIPVEKAWIISHQLKDLRHHEIWKHGNMKVATGFRSGTTSAVHLEEEPQAHLPHDYDCLSFHAPDLVLRELAELEEMPVFEGLMGRSAEVDPVIVALSRSFLPLLGAPENVPHLLADHLMIAFCAHLIGTYGSTPRKPPRAGELSFLQERTAKEMLFGNPQHPGSLAEVAAACGLPPATFTRAFRRSVGMSPYRWLHSRRLDMARSLLANTRLPLIEIAYECGFSDQSHFTRVFQNVFSVPPGAYRRERRS